MPEAGIVDAPDFSVVICTRNRAEPLATVLETIVAADRPRGTWELVVVDNGSTDATPDVIERFADRLPIRRVHEPTAGLSNARNCGVQAVRGRFILWTDDDVRVRPTWLAAFADAFRTHPEAAIFGGIVLPLYAAPETPWFVDAEDQLRSLLAYRKAEGPMQRDYLPFGACYALRTAEQRRHLYDPDLGVAPGRRTGGEETAVIEAIFEEGGRGVWVPGGIVDHVISRERQSKDYIVQYYHAHGRMNPDWEKGPAWLRVAGVPVNLWLNVPRRYVAYRARRALGRNWVRALRDYARALGTIEHWKEDRN